MIDKDEFKKDVLVLDIECFSEYDINKEFDKYVATAKVKYIGFYSYIKEKYYEVPVLGNEELIKKFISEHRVVVGFNSNAFDIPILKNNNLWPEKGYRILVDMKVVLSPEIGCKNRGSYMGYEFKKYSLKEVGAEMGLSVSKGEIDYEIFKKDIYTNEEIKEIKEYLRKDIVLTKEMFDKSYDYWWPFTNFVSEKNIINYSWMISSLSSVGYKYACNVMGWEEIYGEKGEKTDGGGRVIEPRKEEEREVWYLDVRSLYPHIYALFNLFMEVLAGTLGAWHGNDVFKVNGYYDISSPHKLAIDMMEKLKWRIELKKKNPKDPMVYAIKILLNIMYGANRSPVFVNLHTENSGEDCCFLGRQINKIMEAEMNNKGYDIIAGDTDSIFVKYRNGKRTWEEVRKDLDEIVNYILSNVPFPQETFDIEIEHYIDYIGYHFDEENDKTLKKNYFYIYTDKNGEKQVEIMGLPVKKVNATLLGQKILKEHIIPRMKKELKGKFEKAWIESLIIEKAEKDIGLLAQEYKSKPYHLYSLTGKRCLTGQISKAYLNEKGGTISLIKNRRVGKVGKDFKYCTLEEAKQYNLQASDLNLKKVYNELNPFCIENLAFKKGRSKAPQTSGFFDKKSENNNSENISFEISKRGFF